MSVFLFDKISRESNLLRVLEDRFFITARRNKILAKWAGGRIGYKNLKLSHYVRKIVLSYILLPDDQRLVDKIEADFVLAGVNIKREEIVNKMRTAEIRSQNRRKSRND